MVLLSDIEVVIAAVVFNGVDRGMKVSKGANVWQIRGRNTLVLALR